MASVEPLKVLVVIGDPALAGVVAHALAHPRLQVETAVSEQSIVSALTTRQFELVVVGGRVGKRGPLVLCDVVRVRQAAAVLVLLGDETDDAALRDHRSRQLPRVRYEDLRGVAPGPEQGARARAGALAMLEVAEDADSAARWPEELSPGEAQAIHAPDAEATAPAPVEPPPAMEPEAEPEPVRVEAGAEAGLPVFGDAVTEDDLTFAARTVTRARGVDFRSEPAAAAAADGADRATTKLRERVRELERQFARLAHVYGGRVRDFDGAAARIAGLEGQVRAAEQRLADEREVWRQQKADRDTQLDALSRRAEVLDARLRELTEETSRLRDEGRSREAGFATMLEQAREAFVLLRDQSAQTVGTYERRVAELEKAVQGFESTSALAREAHLGELSRLREVHAGDAATLEARRIDEVAALRAAHLEELSSLRAAHQEEVGTLRQTAAESASRLAASESRLDELTPVTAKLAVATETLAEIRAEGDRTRTELEALRARAAGAEAALATAREHEAEAVADAERGGREALAAKEAELATSAERRVSLEASLREAEATRLALERDLAERSARLDEREQQVSELERRVEARGVELEELRRTEAGLRQEVERASTRALDGALDARLVALEEHIRLAGEAAERQAELLTAIDSRTVKQATLADRLLRIIEPPETGGGGAVTPLVAATRLAERMRPEHAMGRSGGAPWSLVLVLLALVGVGGGVALWMRSDGPAPPARNPAPPEAVAAPIGREAPTTPVAVAGQPAAEPRLDEPPELDVGAAETLPAAEPVPKAGVKAAAKPASPVKPAATPAPLTADDKKNLRRKLMDGYKARHWDEAATAGQRLRGGSKLDAEAELALGECLREAGRVAEAREVYSAFLTDFPGHRYAPDVRTALDRLPKK